MRWPVNQGQRGGASGHYSNPPSPGEMANQNGVKWPDLIDAKVRTAVGELYNHVFSQFRALESGIRSWATRISRCVHTPASERGPRTIPPALEASCSLRLTIDGTLASPKSDIGWESAQRAASSALERGTM